MPIPLRTDFDAQMARAAARRSKDGPQARRLLALATIYEGASRTEAAKIGGVTLQIVRDWVMKFNAHGPGGLIDRKPPGQPSRLNGAHRAALAAILASGPIPAVHGVVRWRVVDLCQWIFEEFRVGRRPPPTSSATCCLLMVDFLRRDSGQACWPVLKWQATPDDGSVAGFSAARPDFGSAAPRKVVWTCQADRSADRHRLRGSGNAPAASLRAINVTSNLASLECRRLRRPLFAAPIAGADGPAYLEELVSQPQRPVRSAKGRVSNRVDLCKAAKIL
jgi:transposase